MVAQRGVGGDRVDAGHRVQVATALVQDRVDVKERLEPGSEPTAGPARALGDRRHAPVARRVQMKDAIRLSVADRAQHDRLGPQ
jgi:hypothetical protein